MEQIENYSLFQKIINKIEVEINDVDLLKRINFLYEIVKGEYVEAVVWCSCAFSTVFNIGSGLYEACR